MSDPLTDSGFFDAEAARVLTRRVKIRVALKEARVSSQALLDILQEAREPLSREGASLVEQAVRLATGDETGAAGGFGVRLSEAHAMSEEELLECVSLLPHLLDQIGVGLRHGLFSGLSDTGAIRPSDDGHSLCGSAK